MGTSLGDILGFCQRGLYPSRWPVRGQEARLGWRSWARIRGVRSLRRRRRVSKRRRRGRFPNCGKARDRPTFDPEGRYTVRDDLFSLGHNLEDRAAKRLQRSALRLLRSSQVLIDVGGGHCHEYARSRDIPELAQPTVCPLEAAGQVSGLSAERDPIRRRSPLLVPCRGGRAWRRFSPMWVFTVASLMKQLTAIWRWSCPWR